MSKVTVSMLVAYNFLNEEERHKTSEHSQAYHHLAHRVAVAVALACCSVLVAVAVTVLVAMAVIMLVFAGLTRVV